jgi:hypothetical protein
LVRVAASLMLALLAVGAAATTPLPPPTKVESRPALERLLGSSGITLQWISWTNSKRGPVDFRWAGKTLILKGEQHAVDGKGHVSVEGRIVRIDKNEFILNGTIIINETPDAGRACQKTGDWRFAVTQNRKYWRLREFEWCDGLTDYIDIYF